MCVCVCASSGSFTLYSEVAFARIRRDGTPYERREEICARPIPLTLALDIFFTLKSKFAVHRAPNVCVCAWKGWKNPRPKQIWCEHSFRRWTTGLVACLQRMVWVFIYGRAKRPKEKIIIYFLNFILVASCRYFFVFSHTRLWSSTICRNGKIPGLHAANSKKKKTFMARRRRRRYCWCYS